ncbi:MAG: hypothetical protein L6R35_000532 [Caloplaca aegaea]|nr:MAG: hypothetical protein L6R35_000532 [Caloplaca aegaea]
MVGDSQCHRLPKRQKATSTLSMTVTTVPKCFISRTTKRRTHDIDATGDPEQVTVPAVHTTASSSNRPRPSLASLPAELRERVYNELLHENPSSLSKVLTVNRLISGEVRPWLFKQPVTFNGQQHLFRWLSEVETQFLRHVRIVRFRLHDIDIEKICDSFEERLRRTSIQGRSKEIGHPYGEACRQELEKILAALKRFEKLKSLTILPGQSSTPRPPSDMEKGLLDLIGKHLSLSTLEVPRPRDAPRSAQQVANLTNAR